MSKTFVYHLPGITCVNCIIPIEKVLNECKALKIDKFAVDLLTKTLTVSFTDELHSELEISDSIKNLLDEIGVECVENRKKDEPVEEFLLPPLLHKLNQKIRVHQIKGAIGTLLGIGIIAFTLSGATLPLVGMYVLTAASTVLTLALGAEFYFDAAKKFFKAKTLTMDALFTVSTLTVIGVSIASLFVPWLPMMLETGLLIFGFRHLGKALEASLIQKVTGELSFKDRAVKTVLKKQHEEKAIHAWEKSLSHSLQPGDIIRVSAGEVVPVDGCVESEASLLYTTIVTGAVLPSLIQKGENILAGMKVPDDVEYIEMVVSHTPEQSYLAKLDQKILQSNQEKAPIETATNKILQYFVPGILGLAAIAGVVIGACFTPALAIQCATSILVSACPCTLGFITSFAIKIGVSKALENGVQFKSGKTLQQADAEGVVFDLHGTSTTGVPVVTDYQIYPNQNTSPEDFFQIIAAMEKHSKHPVAKAMYAFSEQRNWSEEELVIDTLDQSHHSGMKAVIHGDSFLIGNTDLLLENGIDPAQIVYESNHAEQVIFLVKNNNVLGYLKLKDPLREDAKLTISELKKMGKTIYLCTGATEELANQYAVELGIPVENVQANCMNSTDQDAMRTKTHFIAELKKHHKRVAMIGDAANDAIAISKSDFGIAVKSNAGDVVTQEQAGAVIDNASLLPVVTAFAVAKQTVNSIKQNLIMSLAYNSIVLLVAGGALLTVGFSLNPAIGVALMVFQSALVLANQYRIKHQAFHVFSQEEQNVVVKAHVSTYGQFVQNGLMSRDRYQSGLVSSLVSEVSPDISPTHFSRELVLESNSVGLPASPWSLRN